MKQVHENCVAFVFARGGSKGIPRKNLREVGGLPLISHSIRVAQNCDSINSIVVSTDDDEIAAVAKAQGADVPFMRPADLSGDGSSEYDAWKHAIRTFEQVRGEKIDVFVSLPPTSPLRSVVDVEDSIREFRESDADTVITVREAARSPYFNMVRSDSRGFSHLVNLAADGTRYVRRQDVPTVYDITTVAYVSSPTFILDTESFFSGRVRSVVVPEERAVDIDTMLDLRFAEFLIKDREEA